VALVTYALQVGGVETFLRHLADFFRDRGDTVVIVETQARGRWSGAFAAAGYQVRQVLPLLSWSRLHHVRRVAAALAGFDALILNDSPAAQAGLGLLPRQTAVVPVLHLALPQMVRNATGNAGEWDTMAAVSPATGAAALTQGIAPGRIRVIPNGVPVPAAWPRRAGGGATAVVRAIYVGSLDDAQKGVLLLPEVLARVLAARRAVQLDVVGDGPDRAALAAAFRRECPGAAVALHGALSNERTLELMGAADVLLLPSRFEGLPLVLLEALARGVVPVASRLPGSTDFVVEDGASGILVAPGDAAGFARALAGLGDDRAQLSGMSQRAWETARDRFTVHANGQAYAQLIDDSRGCGQRPPRSGRIDPALLGDWTRVPLVLRRPLRAAARLLGAT
jgi:glycosyltransferase involved in cell wall biosynthesis